MRTSGPDAPAAVHVELVQDDRAAGQARRAAREVLTRWRLPALIDTIILAVSELVTNGIRHGRPPVSLELRRARGVVDVRVHDGDPTEPSPAAARAGAESGRGLGIVRALATAVGCDQVPGDGKVMYATFDVSTALPARK